MRFQDDLGRTLVCRDGLDRAVVVVDNVVKARHIDARDLRGAHEKLVLAPALSPRLTVQLDELDIHLLALADKSKIDKIRDGFAVVHRRAARDNERCERRAFARVQRHAC